MGEIVHLSDAYDAAWEAYRAMAVEVLHDPSRLLDRDFMARHARLYDRFQRLACATDRKPAQ